MLRLVVLVSGGVSFGFVLVEGEYGSIGCIFFFKQKTAYEMRISDWSSDVCSSDLQDVVDQQDPIGRPEGIAMDLDGRFAVLERVAGRRRHVREIGRESCRERVCQYV